MKSIETQYSVRDGGHYAPAVEAGGVYYISGQLSFDPESGKIPEGGILAETEQALKNLETVLHAAGLEKEHVALCRLYIPDVKYWPEVNEVYGRFFGQHRPARVVVPSNTLYGGCLIEIEAVASRQ